MLYPHRVRFTDPRNRQPAGMGIAYDAIKYDYVWATSVQSKLFPSRVRVSDEIVKTFNDERSEPLSIVYPQIDVQCLVSMVNDGTRNLGATSYSVRVPEAEFKKVSAYFGEQRARSIREFGYRTSLPHLTFSNGYWTSEAFPSSLLAENVEISELDIIETDGNESPLAGRQLPTILGFDDLTDATDYTLKGYWPPIRGWSLTEVDDGYELRNGLIFGDIYAIVDDPYPTRSNITRMDTYPDMVDFRITVPFTKL